MMIEREVVFLVCAYMCERVLICHKKLCVCVCVRFDDRLNNNKKAGKETRVKGGVRTKHLRVRDRHLRS